MSNRLIKFMCLNLSKFSEHGVRLKVALRHLSQRMSVEKAPRQVPREKPAVTRGRTSGHGYPLLIIPVTAFGLGTWQVQRREWKLNLINELEEKMSSPPVPLPDNLEDVINMEYRRVKVRGTFDHSRELLIGPRSDVTVVETLGNRAESGVYVVTPLKLSDRDYQCNVPTVCLARMVAVIETILVNRGFVPFSSRPSQLRSEGQVEGEVEIVGVIRLNDKKMIFESDPLKDGYWLTRNVDEMAEIAETAKVFIDADMNSTVPGGPRGGQTRVALRNEHLTYIITWYSLAAFTFFLWYKAYRRPRVSKTVLDYINKEQKRK